MPGPMWNLPPIWTWPSRLFWSLISRLLAVEPPRRLF